MKDVFRSGNRRGKRGKKYSIKDAMSIIINISFMNYIKWTRVTLPVVFKNFEVVCIFLLIFRFTITVNW